LTPSFEWLFKRRKGKETVMGKTAPTLVLEPRPGTYALVLNSPGEATVQIGRLGKIRLRRGWYVYVGSALAEKTGVLRRVGRHADLMRPKQWNIDFAKPYLRLLEIWFTHDPARRECTWSAAVGGLPGAEVHLKEFGGRDCRAGCPAHFYYFAERPTLDAFKQRLYERVPDHGAVGLVAAPTPEALADHLTACIRGLRVATGNEEQRRRPTRRLAGRAG
jgi:Uri superfamily endonuclease